MSPHRGRPSPILEKAPTTRSIFDENDPPAAAPPTTRGSGEAAPKTPSPAHANPPSPIAPPIAGKREAILFSCGDDHYELALNGNIVASGGGGVVRTPLQLGTGDVFTVRVFGKRFAGFACYIAFPATHQAIISEAKHWNAYNPTDREKWFDPSGTGPLSPVVTTGRRIESAEKYVIRPNFDKSLKADEVVIWGTSDPSYLTLRIIDDCLVDSNVPLPPAN